ncbi:MAG: FapA family protein [Oscillospiraceae bacterium]|nr:FapA family protein [Oscillospiraceae bacterium]
MFDAAKIKVSVSQDRMHAYLSIDRPDPGQTLERSDIMSALADKRVAYGIIESEIDRIVEIQSYDSGVLIAQGKPAAHGKDGFIEYLFDLNDEMAPKVLGDGKVDYYDMNIIRPVLKGEALCRLHEPTLGVDGSSVLGAVLTARNGKPAQMPRGRNTQPSDAGDALLSSIDGQIKRNGKNIDVIQEFEVKKNVDFSTGNIQFPGSVTVRGNVLSGFEIQSGGDVTIYGLVEKAKITSFGNIILHGGMTGQGGGALRAGGDIFAKYVENSLITANGKITAECIMHSTVRAGLGIELIGRKGLLVGGSSKAREYVKAVTVGSQFATLTEIEVGTDPKQNDRLKDIKNEILQLETEQKKVDQALNMFANMEKSGIKLTPQKEIVYDRTRKIFEEQTAKLSSLRTEHDEIEASFKKHVHGYVRVDNVIYSGVKISIVNTNMMLKEDLQHCTLKSDGDSIRVTAY